MDTPADVKQACIDLSTAAIALFDLIDADGVDAPIDSHDGIASLRAMKEASEALRFYYAALNVERMVALGLSVKSLFRLIDE